MTIGAVATQGQTKLQRARVWLVVRLLDGPEAAISVLEAGEEAGFNQTLVKRASKGLIMKTHQSKFGGTWSWALLPVLATEGVNDHREALVKKLLEATQ